MNGKGAVQLPDMELIVRVSSEGGDIKLYGQQNKDGWLFRRQVVDQTSLLIEEPSVEHESEIAHSWADAVQLLDKYRWHRMSPRTVHPAFREQVWAEISRRADEGLVPTRQMDNWREKCDQPPQPAK